MIEGMAERTLLAQARELARLGGWLTMHPLESRGSEPGWPDLALCRPPELLFIELKAQKGRVRPEQQVWLDALNGCGIEAFVVRPSDLNSLRLRLLAGRTGEWTRRMGEASLRRRVVAG